MKKPKLILDSCTIKYGVKTKNYTNFNNSWILPFQVSELNELELVTYFNFGGKIQNVYCFLKGDNNFLVLNHKKYIILTYDRKLKRKLKKLSFQTCI